MKSRIIIELEGSNSFYVRKSGRQRHFDTYSDAMTYALKLVDELQGAADITDLVPLDRRTDA